MFQQVGEHNNTAQHKLRSNLVIPFGIDPEAWKLAKLFKSQARMMFMETLQLNAYD